MAPRVSENFVASVESAARQMEVHAPIGAGAPGGASVTREAVLRELLDDSHARLRDLQRSLESLKDYLTI